MPTFGLGPDGFNLPSQEDLLALVEADEKADISPIIDVSSSSRLGQLNGIFTRQLAVVWEAIQAVYKSNDPDAAEGDALTNIGKLTGTQRRPPTYTTVLGQVVTDDVVQLLSGVHFASLHDDPNVRFTPAADFNAEIGAGTYGVLFRSENAGPVECPIGQLTVMATAVTHWTGISNPVAATIGHVADDDSTLEQRREDELALTGSSTEPAMRADVLASDDNVISVKVFENDGATLDANGLPPHSFEVLVFDSGADDDAVAQAIWDSRPAGVRVVGTGSSGTAHDRDGDGNFIGPDRIVPFTRATERQVFLTYVLVKDAATYGTDAEFKTAIVAACRKKRQPGDPVIASRTQSFAFGVPGVISASLTLDFSASPSNTANLLLGPRELATFDESRIGVV